MPCRGVWEEGQGEERDKKDVGDLTPIFLLHCFAFVYLC